VLGLIYLIVARGSRSARVPKGVDSGG
jgi:hypothetical protein